MTETIEQQCQRVMESRGYLVVTTEDSYAIGEVIPSTTDRSTNRELNHPTVVICETDARDFAGHLRAFSGEDLPGPVPAGVRFYRVIAE